LNCDKLLTRLRIEDGGSERLDVKISTNYPEPKVKQ
jgi:hypothetical protein